ncbi:hypothetical protein EFK13_18880 [Bacillus cabrialesii]|nr:hypothetical protein [Bacillus cabrialesii]UQE78737.1 hypothetical protein EFK13_18880 [Bacillus cabrialesii]
MRQNHLLAGGFFICKKRGASERLFPVRTGKIATALFFGHKPFWDADMHD